MTRWWRSGRGRRSRLPAIPPPVVPSFVAPELLQLTLPSLVDLLAPGRIGGVAVAVEAAQVGLELERRLPLLDAGVDLGGGGVEALLERVDLRAPVGGGGQRAPGAGDHAAHLLDGRAAAVDLGAGARDVDRVGDEALDHVQLGGGAHAEVEELDLGDAGQPAGEAQLG